MVCKLFTNGAPATMISGNTSSHHSERLEVLTKALMKSCTDSLNHSRTAAQQHHEFESIHPEDEFTTGAYGGGSS